MAVYIPSVNVDKKFIESVNSLLSFKKKVHPKFNNNNNSLQAYDCIDEGDGKMGYLVPYTFARIYFQSTSINSYINHVLHSQLEFKGKLREYQKPVVREAINHLSSYGTATLNLYTGFGKTITTIYIAILLKISTCVLCPARLASQWAKTLDMFSDICYYVVGTKGKNKKIPESPPPVTICADTRYDKLPEEYRHLIGLLIVDEAHLYATNNKLKAIMSFRPKYIIFATATFKKSNGAHKLLEMFVGQHKIVRISEKPFNIIKYNTNLKFVYNRRFNNAHGTMVTNICKNKIRNNMILELVKINLNYKILIMTRRDVNHAHTLEELIKNNKISVDRYSGTKDNYNDSNVLVGTVDKMGSGFDEKMKCEDYNGNPINLLILVCPISDIALLEQVVGRAFRSETPNVIHLIDNYVNERDVPALKNQWIKAEKWYKSRNGNIIEYHTNNEEKNNK